MEISMLISTLQMNTNHKKIYVKSGSEMLQNMINYYLSLVLTQSTKIIS